MKHIFLTLLICFICNQLSAYDFKITNEKGQTFYFNFVGNKKDGIVEYTSEKSKYPYNKRDALVGDIELSNEVTYKRDTYKVIAVGTNAFYNCNSISSVTIPEGIIKIGRNAFEYSGIRSVEFPSSVTNIGLYAFNDTKLQEVKIPNNLKILDSGVFARCSDLRKVTLNASLTEIGFDAFYNCESLESIDIPASVVKIGSGAFQYCKSLTQVNIANPNTILGTDVYKDSKYEVLLAEKHKREVQEQQERKRQAELARQQRKEQEDFLMRFERLNEPIVIKGIQYCTNNEPNSVTLVRINWDVALNYYDVHNFVIPSHIEVYGKQYTVTSIGSIAFKGSAISAVTIPNTIKLLKDNAFASCLNLTSITVPSSVTDIYDECFCGCINLSSINIPSSVRIHKDVFVGTPDYMRKLNKKNQEEINQLISQYSRRYGRDILIRVINVYKNYSNVDDARWALPIGTPLEFLQIYTRKFTRDDNFLRPANYTHESTYGKTEKYYDLFHVYEFVNGKLNRKYDNNFWH